MLNNKKLNKIIKLVINNDKNISFHAYYYLRTLVNPVLIYYLINNY
jgi:hypothetical protein